MSDLKLTDSGVIAEGSYFAVHAASFELKDSERFDASRGRGHWRRALIHETDDRLIINYDNDYKGVQFNCGETGLRVMGDASFSNKTTVKDLLILDLGHYPAVDQVSGTGIDGRPRRPNKPRTKIPASLVEIIKGLNSKISRLESRVHALES